MKRIAVIGAGVAGVNTAYQLAMQGFGVTVFEKNLGPALECSFANGGQVSVCNSSTWTNWRTVAKAAKWMLKKDAPLLFSPKPEPEKLLWLAGFLKATAFGKYKENTVKTIIMGLESRAEMEKITQTWDLHYNKLNSGMLHTYSNWKSFKQAESERELFESNGVEWESLTPDEIYNLDYAAGQMKNLVGGIYTPSDWSGDINLYCSHLSAITQAEFEVDFEYNSEVVSVFQQSNGKAGIQLKELLSETREFDAVVICNGHLLQKFARAQGEFLNVYPVKGYSITIPLEYSICDDDAPKVSLLDDDKKIVSSYFPSYCNTDRLRVAGTAELAGHDNSIRMERIQPLLNWVKENFPHVDTRYYQPWACLRPMSSDMMPIVRQSKNRSIWYNGGYGHLGWTLSAGLSKKLATDISLYLRNK
jgi:D-amino-acid dehydrogenase